jgi:dihydrofolate reductase
MDISIIAAMDRKGLIGLNGSIPWDVPEDRWYFREITWGKIVVMGRRTAESLEQPLPGRLNIVLSRGAVFRREGFLTFGSPEEFFAAYADRREEVFVIGGAQIYALFLPCAGRMYLTDIDGVYKGDTWFPAFSPDQWRAASVRPGISRVERVRFTFRVLEKEGRGLTAPLRTGEEPKSALAAGNHSDGAGADKVSEKRDAGG